MLIMMRVLFKHIVTYIPQMGNTPNVMPRAPENANCFGSAPLTHRVVGVGGFGESIKM